MAETAQTPMCLRTHRYLTDDHRIGPAGYRCAGQPPACAGGEVYGLQSVGSSAATAVGDAFTYASRRFRAQRPPRLTIWLVEEPHAPDDQHIPPEATRDRLGQPVIYLTGQTENQLAYQAAHEVVHVLFTPIQIHHWTHEIVAVLFSLEFLEASGKAEYLAAVLAAQEAEAVRMTLDEFVRSQQPHRLGFYGRASVFGRQLIQIVGPAGYVGIARHWTAAGQPDFWAWVDALPAPQRKAVTAISPSRSSTE